MKKNNQDQSELKLEDYAFRKDSVKDSFHSKVIENEPENQDSNSIERRKFLGKGLLGIAGLGLPLNAGSTENTSVKKFVNEVIFAETELYRKQSDSFAEKIELIQQAWSDKDFRMVRSLSDSIRNTGIQAQIEYEDPGKPVSGAGQFGNVSSLPPSWKIWANGWKYFKAIGLEEKGGISRRAEPVEVLLSFPNNQMTSAHREIRVAEVKDGVLKEVTSQVFGLIQRGTETFCKLMFLADSNGNEKRNYLIFYGNPDAELPNYASDMEVRGEGYNLQIENQYFIAYLSKLSGQLERMTIKREHGVELYAGGPDHGEIPCIDWAHDYVSEDNFMKVRMQYWDECPDFEVVKGPICTIVRRWGFPRSAIHPIYNPARLNIDIEYRFYAGLPYFHKLGKMKAIKQFVATALRDDEWVFAGQPFTGSLWMGADEKLRIGEIDEADRFSIKGFGFFNKDSRDSFVGLYLEHSAEVLTKFLHTGASLFYYQWAGTTWVRYPLERNQIVPEGAILRQKNAYVTIPFTVEDGPARIENLRKELMSPLTAYSTALPVNLSERLNLKQLARPGEAQNSTVSKQILWDALKNCKDQQLYIADISIVELGYIYDLSVDDVGVVKVLMTMPHRGRPLSSFFTWGSSVVHRAVSKTIMGALTEIPGVRKVIVEQTRYPEWNSNFITKEGRKKLGI
ncbi:MAG: hypothetical protein WC220_12520 [Pedobacter sp.]